MKRKNHLPKPGHGTGLKSEARCGRMASYGTGDWKLLENLAFQFPGLTCARCFRDLCLERRVDYRDFVLPKS